MSVDAPTLTISPPIRRLAALALFIAAVALVFGGIMLPAVERYESLESGISESAAALQRFDAAAARLPRLEQRQKAVNAALAAQGGFLEGPNDSLIAAALQSRIKEVVDQSHAELRSTQILPPKDDNGFRRFTARVEVTASADALERTWYAMEAGAPYLFVDNFDIEARQRPRLDRTQPPLMILDVRFDVSAYARGASS